MLRKVENKPDEKRMDCLWVVVKEIGGGANGEGWGEGGSRGGETSLMEIFFNVTFAERMADGNNEMEIDGE